MIEIKITVTAAGELKIDSTVSVPLLNLVLDKAKMALVSQPLALPQPGIATPNPELARRLLNGTLR